jgi:nucleoside-diphosphate-sugar epimerase
VLYCSVQMRALVTGATGFIGGHIVDALLDAGHDPIAGVRPGSDTARLERLGVPLVYCDVTDPASLRSACDDVDSVFHTAAIVATYGNWEHYREIGVEGTEHVLDAAIRAGVPRFIHVSSIAVYGFERRPGRILREDMPLQENPERWNHYVREKALSEKAAWRAHDAGRIGVTTLRPSVVLGPRDRNVVPRMARLMTTPIGGLIGLGANRVGCVVVTDLARLAVLASVRTEALGRAYNASGTGTITQRQIVQAFCHAFGKRVLPWRMPFTLALASAGLLDEIYATAGIREEPFVSRFSVAILGSDFVVDCSRAARELGWKGECDYRQAIRESVEYYRGHR